MALLDRIRQRFLRPPDPPGPVDELRRWQRKMQNIWSRIERYEERYHSQEEIDDLWRQFEAMEPKETELLYAVRRLRKLI